MSQENVEVLRGTRIALRPLSERAARRRTPDEQFFVRFPALYRRQAAFFAKVARARRENHSGNRTYLCQRDSSPVRHFD
jgi:hypothetical protein